MLKNKSLFLNRRTSCFASSTSYRLFATDSAYRGAIYSAPSAYSTRIKTHRTEARINRRITVENNQNHPESTLSWWHIPAAGYMIYALFKVFRSENTLKRTKEQKDEEKIIQFVIKELYGEAALINYQTYDMGLGAIGVIRNNLIYKEAYEEYQTKPHWWRYRANKYYAELEKETDTQFVKTFKS
jgi:hypothetical protein